MTTLLIPALRRKKLADLCEFKASGQPEPHSKTLFENKLEIEVTNAKLIFGSYFCIEL